MAILNVIEKKNISAQIKMTIQRPTKPQKDAEEKV